MSQSEVARIKQEIETTYLAGKLGLAGLTFGMARHSFIEKRTENLGRLHSELQELIGETEAMTLFVETVAKLPDKPLRHIVLMVLREELGDNEDTECLIRWVEDMWKTVDRLVERFGEDDARKIIHACSPMTG